MKLEHLQPEAAVRGILPDAVVTAEARLYKEVTEYVREEFNRAEALRNEKRAGTVGPGHPLLDAVLDLTLELHRGLLARAGKPY